MSEILSNEQLESALADRPQWTLEGGQLVRRVRASSFPNGIDIVVAVADRAEAAQHHPDIDIRWTTLTFALMTHSEGGITEKDIALAGEIDAIVDSAA